MNYIDIIILVPIVWGVYRGFSKGLIIEVASLVALVAGVWCAIHFNEVTASVLVNDFGWELTESYVAPVSFAFTFIAVALVIVLVSRLLDKLLSAVALGGVNKLFGAAFGGVKALLIVAILVYFINQFDQRTNFISEDRKDESLFYDKIVTLVDDWMPTIDLNEIKKDMPDVKSSTDRLKNI